jgi:DNA primase
MPWIEENDLKAIKAQADIVDVISRYISLEKKGKEYMGICPFHADSNPSLHVNVQKQIYKCFSCGAGGDVFKFVSSIEKIPYPSAVAKVADMIGYKLSRPLSFQKKETESPYKKDYEILNSYISFMNYELYGQNGQKALEYAHNRKMSDELIERFQIGYAPSSASSLRFLQAKNYKEQELSELGLVHDTYGKSKAFFEERLVIPIHDVAGHPVGFTARTLLSGSDIPKYINTGETRLYHKSDLIFNYHRAKEHCRQAGRVILCEGAMDVLGFEKADVHEAVANLGVAFSNVQLDLLAKLRVPVVVCYDADRAGRQAAYKFGRAAIAAGLKISIANNKLGKDPDEVFNEYGAEQTKKLAENTRSYIEFLFDYLAEQYNLENYEDKKKIAEEIGSAIHKMASGFEAATYYQRLKELTGFDLQQQNAGYTRPKNQTQYHRRNNYQPMPDPGRKRAEDSCLYMMLHSKAACRRFQEEIGFFLDETSQQLSLYIYDIYRSKDQLDYYELLAMILEEDVRNLLERIEENPYGISLDQPAVFEDALGKIRECMLTEQIERINQQIASLSDVQAKLQLSAKKKELIEQRNTIRTHKEG